jgi:PAS domain S-box-containing protein
MSEEALCNPSTVLRELYNLSHDAILFLDAGGFRYGNAAAARMFGYTTVEDFVGRTPADLSPPTQADGQNSCSLAQRHIEAARANGAHSFAWTHRRQDGTLFPAEVSLTAIRRGEEYFLYALIRDLTAQTRAEVQLHLDERRLDSLLRLSQMSDASLSEITTFALEEAVALTHSEVGYLAFVDEAEGRLTMHAWSKSAMARCQIEDKPIVFSLEDTGLWGEAVRQRQPVVTNDYQAPNPLKKGLPVGHLPISRHMNVPVFEGNAIVAVVGVGNKQEEYNEADIRQLTLLLEGMWKHIQRKRTDEELERYRNHLEELVQQRTADLELSNEQLEEEIRTRTQAEAALTRRLEAERLVNTVSGLFAGIETMDLDKAVIQSLEKTTTYLEADRVTAFLLSETNEQDYTVHQWCAPGVPSTAARCSAGLLGQFTTWMPRLRAGEVVYASQVSGLPHETMREAAALEPHQIESLLLMPTLVNGRLRGFLTVATVLAAKAWPDEDIAVLRVLSEIVFGAVQRIEAKDALRRERDFAEALIDNAQALVMLLDTQGRIVRLNRCVEDVTGFFFQDVDGLDAISTFIPETERGWIRTLLGASFRGEPMHGTTTSISTKDGQLREVQWHGRLLHDEAGQTAHILLVGHDITERRRTELELERKTRDLALRVKQIDCLHSISRLLEEPDLTLPQILRQAVELIPPAWQHSDLACARITLDDLVVETANFAETLWRQAAPIMVDGQFAGAVDVCYLVAEDEQPFLDAERELIQDLGERLSRVIERYRAQAKVRALQQQIEYVLGATKTGLCIADADYRLQYVDHAWQRVYGDPTGKTCYEYFQQRRTPCEDCGSVKALQTKETVVGDEILPLEDGRPVQVTTIPFQNEHGEWLIAKVFVDVSRQKRLERELAQSQKLEAIGQLAAGIAHEINTPTQYIGDNARFLEDAFGCLDTLLSRLPELVLAARKGSIPDSLTSEVENAIQEADLDYLVEEIPKAIDASLDGVERVATIVRAMKEFSHPGGERKQAVDLNRAIESTLTVSRNEWKYVADLVTDFDAQLPMVNCYPSDLNQAILNVLINAGQAIAEVFGDGSHGRGQIRIETRHSDDWVEIRIADTGPGIPDNIRDKVFNPFFTTKDVGKGTGQGLAIVYHTIVEKHQGTIHFETEVGVGTTFIIRLPIASAPPGA